MGRGRVRSDLKCSPASRAHPRRPERWSLPRRASRAASGRRRRRLRRLRREPQRGHAPEIAISRGILGLRRHLRRSLHGEPPRGQPWAYPVGATNRKKKAAIRAAFAVRTTSRKPPQDPGFAPLCGNGADSVCEPEPATPAEHGCSPSRRSRAPREERRANGATDRQNSNPPKSRAFATS